MPDEFLVDLFGYACLFVLAVSAGYAAACYIRPFYLGFVLSVLALPAIGLSIGDWRDAGELGLKTLLPTVAGFARRYSRFRRARPAGHE
jgi:hypothetical protein